MSQQTTCYLLLGASDGALDISLDVDAERIAALTITPRGGFGGMVWDVLAESFVGLPLDVHALNDVVARYRDAGLVPHELDLRPLVKAIVNLAT
ncbi:MAG: hypothetical protein HY868_02810 [Chloroflexi bacterium]|nr:hypothetical protein [Chloroflexota bacterium]